MNPFPLEGIANSQGIPSPPPSPKGDISAIPAPSSPMAPAPGTTTQNPMLATMYGWANASPTEQYYGGNNDGGVVKTGPNRWEGGPSSRNTGFTDPKDDYLQQAIDTYESMGGGPADSRGGGPGYVYDGGPDQPETSWRDQIYASRAANAGGGSAGGGGGGQARPSSPYQALKSPDMPKFEGEEYAPPERDEAIYDEERRKAMGPGMRALREGTREAISSAQSLDNPNARSKFIQQTLHGYGQGLESVASGAHKTATGVADRRHAEAVSMYSTKFDYKRNEDLMNYKTEIGKIASDFAAESAADFANYNAGFGQGEQDGGTGGGARSKSTYYNNNTPFMGYMN